MFFGNNYIIFTEKTQIEQILNTFTFYNGKHGSQRGLYYAATFRAVLK